MPRFLLLAIFYFVAGCAGYFALFAIARQNNHSLVSWLTNSLGIFYGTLLYVSGLSVIIVACRTCWRAATPSAVAVAIPFTFVPAFIGLIGLIHGYINVYRILSLSGTYPKTTEMYRAHPMVMVCLLVGMCFSFISFALLAVAMLVKSRNPRSSDPAPDSGG